MSNRPYTTSETRCIKYTFDSDALGEYEWYIAPTIEYIITNEHNDISFDVDTNDPYALVYKMIINNDADLKLFDKYKNLVDNKVNEVCAFIIKHKSIMDTLMDFSNDVEFRDYLIPLLDKKEIDIKKLPNLDI